MPSGNACKNGMIPFVVILALALGAVLLAARSGMSSALSNIAEQKTGAFTRTLATVLVDPFSMGEYDHMQAILDATKKADPDVSYVIVLTPDGKAVATTDHSLKDISVTRNDFEKAALKTTDLVQRPTAEGYEAVVPIKTVIGPAGYLRLGMTRASAEQAASQAFNTALVAALISLLVGAGLFCMVSKNTASGATPS
jgi:uncharacterized membrane protein affecting hemolysin expression